MCHRRTSPTLFESTPLRTHQRHFHPGRAVRLSDGATALFFAGWRWQCCIPRSADLKLPMSNVSNCLVILLRFWPKASSWNSGGRTSRQKQPCFCEQPEWAASTWSMIAIFHPWSTATRRIIMAWSFFTTFLKVNFWNGQLTREERFNFSFGFLKKVAMNKKTHEQNAESDFPKHKNSRSNSLSFT